MRIPPPYLPLYFTIAGKAVANIGKCGSTAVGKAITLAEYPDYKLTSSSGSQTIVEAAENDPGLWHTAPKKTSEPEGDVLVLVRDPIERFRSACAQENLTPSEAIAKIKDNSQRFGFLVKNYHFRPTTEWLREGCKLYRFPLDLPALATELGIAEIPEVHVSGTKPTLSNSERAEVESIYSDDLSLFYLITTAGQVWNSSEFLQQQAIETLSDDLVTLFDNLPKGKKYILKPLRDEVNAALMQGDLQEARGIISTIPTSLWTNADADRKPFLDKLDAAINA